MSLVDEQLYRRQTITRTGLGGQVGADDNRGVVVARAGGDQIRPTESDGGVAVTD